jgi:hypothetical protein
MTRILGLDCGARWGWVVFSAALQGDLGQGVVDGEGNSFKIDHAPDT